MPSPSREERNQQNHRLRARVSKEEGRAVKLVEARSALVAKQDENLGKRLPNAQDPREFIVKGITGHLTHDRVLDFQPEDAQFVGDLVVEVADMKVYKGGTVVLNVQTTDDFLDTITDAIRLSRGHPLFCRLFELFPKPESPYHPDYVPPTESPTESTDND